MHPFKYVLATTVDQAISVLAEYGPQARCLAGGTDLLAQVRAGRYELDCLLDLKGIPEVMRIQQESEYLHIGAAVPCYQIYENGQVASAFPGVTDAVSMIGGIQIQSRASLGGNLCNASPSADGIAPLITHYAVAVIAGPNGLRDMPVENFCTSPGRTVLTDGEFLVSLQLPNPPDRFGAAYQRFIPRNEMDIAVAGVGSSVVLDARGEYIQSARIALAAVGPTPILAMGAGESLVGKKASAEVIRGAGELAREAASPIEDMRGTVAQRRHLVEVLTIRTLEVAIERAREG